MQATQCGIYFRHPMMQVDRGELRLCLTVSMHLYKDNMPSRLEYSYHLFQNPVDV